MPGGTDYIFKKTKTGYWFFPPSKHSLGWSLKLLGRWQHLPWKTKNSNRNGKQWKVYLFSSISDKSPMFWQWRHARKETHSKVSFSKEAFRNFTSLALSSSNPFQQTVERHNWSNNCSIFVLNFWVFVYLVLFRHYYLIFTDCGEGGSWSRVAHYRYIHTQLPCALGMPRVLNMGEKVCI